MLRSATLDWFRGIAILAVIWAHSGLPGLPGAHILIDLFFVISGYLVSKSLIRLHAESSGELRDLPVIIWRFLEGRIRRIVLPLATLVLITLCVAWYILLPDALFLLAQSAQKTLLLQGHLFAISQGNYFVALSNVNPLLHSWSLSLEEWFYLLTPVLILPALMWSRKIFLSILVFILLASLWHADSLSRDKEAYGASYYLLSTRLWEFLVGVNAALIVRSKLNLKPIVNDAIIAAGLAAMVASAVIITKKDPSPGIVTLPAICGILILLILKPSLEVMKFITSTKLFTYFGLKLYSLYLAHYPVIVFIDYMQGDMTLMGNFAKFIISIIIGLIFYHLIEGRFDNWKMVNFSTIILVSITLLSSSVFLSNYYMSSGGATRRLPDNALVALSGRYNINPQREKCITQSFTRFGYSCSYGPSSGPYIALFGDSHSDSIANQLSLKLSEKGIGLRHYWYAECPVFGSGLGALNVFSQECNGISHEGHSITLKDKNVIGVMYAVRWSWYLKGPSEELMSSYWRNRDGIPVGYDDMQDFRQDLGEILSESIRSYENRGVPTYLVAGIPTSIKDPVRETAYGYWSDNNFGESNFPYSLYSLDQSVFDHWVDSVIYSNYIQIVDTSGAFCDGYMCKMNNGPNLHYYDNNHLNELGAHILINHIFTDLFSSLW